MPVSDFVKLQLAVYNSDASSYPYIRQFMTNTGDKWTFSGNKKLAEVEALLKAKAKK